MKIIQLPFLVSVTLLLFHVGMLSAQIINEVCPSNSSTWAYEGDYPDWIELYNPHEFTINMMGFHLTDDLSEPNKWAFPALSMSSHSYVVIPALENASSPEFVNFNLNKDGETIYLFNSWGALVDSLCQPRMKVNHSYGKIDGKDYFFQTPSPGVDNTSEIGYKGYAHTPLFSRVSGFVKPGTSISLSNPEPDEVLFQKNNHSVPFSECSDHTSFVVQNHLQISAQSKGDSLIDSDIVYRTYFTDNLGHQLPIVNLSLDSLALFDEVNGIYMLGEDGEEEWPNSGANFWENRSVLVQYEYFDNKMNLIESMQCDLKIHGGPGSRTKPMKSVQLRARDAYEDNYFELKYFELKDARKFKRLLLRNAGNDFFGTYMKDALFQHHLLQSELDIDLLAYQPVIVYINGHYLGIQNMREKLDVYYFQSNYGVNPNAINLLEGYALSPISGENTDFIALVDYARTHDLSLAEHYDWVAEQLDISSFMDYFITELYTNNRDWPNNNIKLWNLPGTYKWRYVLYDLDAGFRYQDLSLESLHSLTFLINQFSESNPHVALLHSLLSNRQFVNQFINRYADLLNTSFKPSWVEFVFEEGKDKVSHDMKRHYEKWCGPFEQWHERFNGIYGFLNSRPKIVREELSTFFDLPASNNLTVNSYPRNAGVIRLNTIEIDDFPFFGEYFPENKISLGVIPNAGHLFSHWENTRTGETFFSPDIMIDPEAGDYLVAFYETDDMGYNLNIYPNPISDQTTIRFSLSRYSFVEVQIHSMKGEFLSKKYLGPLHAGDHKTGVDFSSFSQKEYVVTLMTEHGRESQTVVKL